MSEDVDDLTFIYKCYNAQQPGYVSTWLFFTGVVNDLPTSYGRQVVTNWILLSELLTYLFPLFFLVTISCKIDCLLLDLLITCSYFLVSRYTELKMLVPESDLIALHAYDMTISSVTIDKEPAEFEHIPKYQQVDERRWSSVSCCKTAADAACSTYLSLLNRELVPNLLISCQKLNKPVGEEGQEDRGDIVPDSSKAQMVNGYGVHSEDKVFLDPSFFLYLCFILFWMCKYFSSHDEIHIDFCLGIRYSMWNRFV